MSKSSSGVDLEENNFKGFCEIAQIALGIRDRASTNILFPFKNSILKGINCIISSDRVSYDLVFPFIKLRFGL